MTCISGQYSQPTANCLGETLLPPASGGAIAFLGPTGESLNDEASELNVRLSAALSANAQLGLGDMIRQTMADHVIQDLPTVPVWIYNLLGDPALHYNVARNLAPLQITTFTPGMLAWTGSLPPYQVQIRTNLNSGAWQTLVSSQIGSQLNWTNAGRSAFFRVLGSQ